MFRIRNFKHDEKGSTLVEYAIGASVFVMAMFAVLEFGRALWAHNALGIIYLTQGNTYKARDQFVEAIRLNPDYAAAHNNLGTAFGNEGLLDEAISEYSRAVHLDPGFTDAHINLGIILVRRGKRSDAIQQFSEVSRIDPNNPQARAWLADLTLKHDQ